MDFEFRQSLIHFNIADGRSIRQCLFKGFGTGSRPEGPVKVIPPMGIKWC